MKPVETEHTNFTYVLSGGTRENDLPVHRELDGDGHPTIRSDWKLTDEERAAIAAGANVYLICWAQVQIPVAIGVDGIEPS